MCEDRKLSKKELEKIIDTKITILNKDNQVLMNVTYYELFLETKLLDLGTTPILVFDNIKMLVNPVK